MRYLILIRSDREKIYFEGIHPMMPIIHRERYTSCKTLKAAHWPPLYLCYAIWAVAAVGSDQHSHQSCEYYNKARSLTEAAALADPLSTQSTFYCAQAWLHLAMHDMICGRFALVWTSTCQAIRLLQIAKVHNLDIVNTSSANDVSENGNWPEAEEKRRAFWFAFCMDRSAFIGQGLPSFIDEKDVRIPTPSYFRVYYSGRKLMRTTDTSQSSGVKRVVPVFHRAIYYTTFSSYRSRIRLYTLPTGRHSRGAFLVRLKHEGPSAARHKFCTKIICHQRLVGERLSMQEFRDCILRSVLSCCHRGQLGRKFVIP